jgi:ribosomal protein S18 acetylase RimI-like enzyme
MYTPHERLTRRRRRVTDTITIRRIQTGEEVLAQQALQTLIPEDERGGTIPSLEHLQSLLNAHTNYLILAMQDTEPIGFAMAYTMPKYYRDGHMAYLYDISVRPDCRKRGIGSRLIEVLKTCLRNQGVESLWVGTDCTNIPAISLYEATGGKREASSFCEFWYDKL